MAPMVKLCHLATVHGFMLEMQQIVFVVSMSEMTKAEAASARFL